MPVSTVVNVLVSPGLTAILSGKIAIPTEGCVTGGVSVASECLRS
jgi:hypothetical protein